jgi:hypothetical protein
MDYTEIRVKGVTRRVPSIPVGRATIIVTGRWLKLAEVHDEDWLEDRVLPSPEEVIAQVRQHKELGADIFTFSQKPDNPMPQFAFYHDWDSIAAIPIISFSHWWTKRVSKWLRQDVNRAAKRGVVVRSVPFTDDFVRGIVDIYNEIPIRQGRPFWHYRKDFNAIRLETETYKDSGEFLGAYVGDELIGFLKMVYVGRLARLMEILSKETHSGKRPTNALIAKAVEICEVRGCSHLTYGNYRYLQGEDGLTAFKHRSGFEEILVPRYYVPLTAIGSLSVRLHLQRGLRTAIPVPILQSLRRARAAFYRHTRTTSIPETTLGPTAH